MRLNRVVQLCLAACVGLSCVGCRSSQPAASPADAPQPVAQETAEAIDNPADLLPLSERTEPFVIEEGKGAGEQVEFVMTPDPDAGENAFRRTTGDKRTQYLKLADDGGIVMTGVHDESHNALTQYDPPLPLIPAGLKPGEPMVVESKMTIVNAMDKKTILDRGTCTQTIVHDLDETLETPAGRFDCKRLTITYEAKLGLAKVRKTAVEHYAEGVGLIREATDEHVQSILLVGWNTKRTVVRKSK